MRKMIRWYLLLILLAAVCILGIWAVSSQNREPTNATLVQNIPDSRERNMLRFPGWSIGADVGILNSLEMEACGL
ncbi:MAG: hypothetical protein LUG56_03800 [Lachnospiraceae bacterium]|nr:hypothetical protein [Lachnospiraceae bacterium]